METISGIFSVEFWWIAPILVTLTTTLTGVLNKGCQVEQTWVKQLVSWLVAAALSVATCLLKFLVFGEPVWLGVICLAVVVGLSSNGFYDIPTIKSVINTYLSKLPIGNQK